jgi:hypothetical protein
MPMNDAISLEAMIIGIKMMRAVSTMCRNMVGNATVKLERMKRYRKSM